MSKPTDKQKSSLARCYTNIGFKFPCCGVEIIDRSPQIENPGEDKTQIFCLYGCGYVFIEDC